MQQKIYILIFVVILSSLIIYAKLRSISGCRPSLLNKKPPETQRLFDEFLYCFNTQSCL